MIIIFVHGRSQEKKDPTGLKKLWVEALNEGFINAKLKLEKQIEFKFPYYGDVLFDLTEKKIRNSALKLMDKGIEGAVPSEAEAEFTKNILLEMAAYKNITEKEINAENIKTVADKAVQNWRVVLIILRLLNRIKGVASALIEEFTKDVWLYLTNKAIRLKVNDIVDKEIPTESECVVVAHSLGSIVAYNVLINRANRSNIKAFVTLGSPLGIKEIVKKLPSDSSPRKSLEGIPIWFNGRDAQDVVALNPILASDFRGPPVVKNYNDIDNRSDNQHGIVEYLMNTEVAKLIFSTI